MSSVFSFITGNRKFLSNFSRFRTMAAATSSTDKHGKPNRLAKEKSPYLLQHAYNPVEWYPWGKEAFDKAKKENKMIFLSVGYSTCHWCHVMERESFEDPEIGKLMSDNFVCIKVDREERPDVDKMYMGFVQATTGSGGWPMSVWLTPDLKPVVGGTYFPPGDRYHGRPGFSTILNYIAEKWRDNSDSVANQGKQLLDAIAQTNKKSASSAGRQLPDVKQSSDWCYKMIAESYDTQWGGFSSAPKFPQPVNLEFMLYYYAANRRTDDAQTALRMVGYTEKMMAQGGIHDHVAQGFHRYSTDKEWHVPHFEKMLYDQGQLAVAYAEMFQITKEDFYADITRDILTYVDRDLGHPEGGFYSAEDADSYPTSDAKEKKEGAFCVWTEAECKELLDLPVDDEDKHKNVSLSDVFCKHYTVRKQGNVDPYQDPHDELTEKNVLIVHGSLKDTAEAFDLDVETTKSALAAARKILFDARLKRPKPHLDTKMITAWNGLMISGFAKASASLNDKTYGDRAVKAADFIRKYLYDEKSKILLRSCYADDERKVVQIYEPIKGFADDYSFFIAALLDLYEFVDHDDRWLKWADELQRKMDELFWDKDDNSGYFQCSSDDKSILIRMKEDQDGAEPSANSMQTLNLVRLANILDSSEYRDRAKTVMLSFGDRLKKLPLVLPKMMCGFMLHEKPSSQIVIVGSRDDGEVQSMLNVVRSAFLPFSVSILLDNATDVWLKSKNAHMKNLQTDNGKATAYFCANFACTLPVNTADELKNLISEELKK